MLERFLSNMGSKVERKLKSIETLGKFEAKLVKQLEQQGVQNDRRVISRR